MIHLKESIVEFRIFTKKVRKARQQISEQYSPGGQTGLNLRGNILLPAQPPAVRMSCLPELSSFIPLPNSVWIKSTGIDCLIVQETRR